MKKVIIAIVAVKVMFLAGMVWAAMSVGSDICGYTVVEEDGNYYYETYEEAKYWSDMFGGDIELAVECPEVK